MDGNEIPLGGPNLGPFQIVTPPDMIDKNAGGPPFPMIHTESEGAGGPGGRGSGEELDHTLMVSGLLTATVSVPIRPDNGYPVACDLPCTDGTMPFEAYTSDGPVCNCLL